MQFDFSLLPALPQSNNAYRPLAAPAVFAFTSNAIV
jgi:hypothetical protein